MSYELGFHLQIRTFIQDQSFFIILPSLSTCKQYTLPTPNCRLVRSLSSLTCIKTKNNIYAHCYQLRFHRSSFSSRCYTTLSKTPKNQNPHAQPQIHNLSITSFTPQPNLITNQPISHNDQQTPSPLTCNQKIKLTLHHHSSCSVTSRTAPDSPIFPNQSQPITAER